MCYINNIVYLISKPGFTNSLDSGDCTPWWTARDDLAAN